MSVLGRILVFTFVLTGLYLLVRNSVMYKSILGFSAATFSKAYTALVRGQW